MFFRAFVKDGDLKGAVDNVKTNTKLYPLADFGKPADHHLRQHLGQAVQHHQRQHLRVLQRAERRRAERARRFRRAGNRRPVRRHRHQKGQPFAARRAHDEDPHRRRGARQCRRALLPLGPAGQARLHLSRPPVADPLRRRQLPVPGRRGADARRARHLLLLRHRHHARDGGCQARHRLCLCRRLPRQGRQVSRRRRRPTRSRCPARSP